MAKKNNQKHSGRRFALGMLIYAVVFLGIVGLGLAWFWGFIDAYEQSRPHIAINAYMNQLTKEHIVDESADVLAMADLNLQSEEACREIMLEALTEEITYARKASACTEDKQVYVLRSGKQVVGSFEIITGEEDKYGFKPWVFNGENFDLSFLMGNKTVQMTVPEGYYVYVNGVALDDSYLVSQQIEQFSELEDYYEAYDLPVFVLNTYEAGPFLNRDFEMEARDSQGNPFVYDESYDKYQLIHNCSAKEEQMLYDFVEEFLDVYVIFAGCANDDRYTNYGRAMKYVVPDGDLAVRMQRALDGLVYAKSKGDTVAGIEVHHYVKLADDAYMADVTYQVDTHGQQGIVRTTTNTRLLIVRQDNQLLVESMMGY